VRLDARVAFRIHHRKSAMAQPSPRHPSGASGSSESHGDQHADEIPRKPSDTNASGDAKSGVGEDNQSAKEGEQSAEDFIRR
jgi:hypothetical protein